MEKSIYASNWRWFDTSVIVFIDMELENMNEQVTPETAAQKSRNNVLHQITPLSKYLALALFVALPFIGGWIGYSNAPVKVLEMDKIVIQEVSIPVTPSDNDSVENSYKETSYTRYEFKSYSTSSDQFLVRGELMPSEIQGSWPPHGTTEVIIRCWKSKMYCAYYSHNTKWSISWVDLLSVKSWNEEAISISGISWDVPDCSKEDGCSSVVSVEVDLINEKVYYSSTKCVMDCATDKYEIVGKGHKIYNSRSDFPVPTVNLVYIGF
jgi:hypothetical protein